MSPTAMEEGFGGNCHDESWASCYPLRGLTTIMPDFVNPQVLGAQNPSRFGYHHGPIPNPNEGWDPGVALPEAARARDSHRHWPSLFRPNLNQQTFYPIMIAAMRRHG
ncbi:hypothetical protein IFM51744_09917 [Aspergillus udagawae]|nr:hypothetical protein IFM51744_09917 [Aspergillus udagawae]